MVCKGICIRLRAVGKSTSKGRYIEGQKRCQRCDIYINWNVSVFCPCCGTRLRYKPRNGKLKLKFNKAKNDVEQVETLII